MILQSLNEFFINDFLLFYFVSPKCKALIFFFQYIINIWKMKMKMKKKTFHPWSIVKPLCTIIHSSLIFVFLIN